ncbi:chitinase-like protein PB1E7.04c [Hyalella azteca]|uniref:Chitinase-like protein PB1E7.04c n=1 Tax=Hyalella azteca TaxID=294128 RepID=A0A8B7PP03_HYAAZ|nr:chitinase-like protein PB1E7.04c [Hyalella azteca]
MAKKQSKSVSTLKTQKNEATQSKLPSRTCKANAAIPVVATKQDKPVTKISKKSVIKEGPKTPKAKPLPNNVPDSNKSNERVKKTGKLSSTPSSSKVLSKIAKKTPKQSSTASKNANVSMKTPLLSKRTTAIKAIKTNDYSILGGRKASMEKKIGQNAKKYKKNIDKTVEVSQISEESEILGPVSTPAAPVSVSGDNIKTANILLQPAAKAGRGKPRGKKIPAGKTSATTRVTRTQQISQSNSTLSQDLQVNESISSGKNTVQAGRHIEVNSVKPLKRKTSNASEITSPSKKVLKITCESVANSNEMKDSGVAVITGEITPTSMSVSDSLFQDSCPPEPSSNALSKVGRASIFDLSSISATKSPIIRTRKVNPKYLDSAVIPSTFSFMKNTIEQGKTTPGSTGPAKLSVSVPTPRILAKDITHRNVVTTLEESSNTSEQEVSEVTRPSKPMLGDRRQKKLLKTTLSKVDLNSNVSNASKSEHSEINSPRNIEKTLKKTTVKKTVNSLKGKKAGSETNNKVEVLESVNSVIRKKTASKSNAKAKVVEGRTISESSRGSINNKVNDAVEESPGTIVKLSQFPIKLAVFRSPSQSTSLEDTTFKPKIINAENSVVEQPRLSKRKLLALALREGKLKKVVNTKTVEKPDVKFNVPVLIKSRNVVLENSHAIPSSAKSKLHTPPSTSESALAESNSTLMKKPIWAHAISPSKKAKRLSSTRSVTPVVQKSSTVFEFSFNSEEEVREKKVVKPKRGRPPKPKVIQKNFKPLSTKTKILTRLSQRPTLRD